MNRNQFNEALQKLDKSPITKKVLQLLLNGHTNAEIAKLRAKSEGTIRKQVSNLYEKFGIESQFPGDTSSQRNELKALFKQYKLEWVSDLQSASENEILVAQTVEQEEAIAKPQRKSVESNAGSIEERYFKATSNFDSLEPLERKSRIQVLEEIASNKDFPRYHWKVMEFLAAFVRRKAPRKEEEEGQEKRSPELREDIQAALTVIGQPHPEKDPANKTLDLSHTDIRGANLQEAHLQGFIFYRANLQTAILSGASLQRVDLRLANLGGADLQDARLEHANLYHANLREAQLCHADLQSAGLEYTDLTGANLAGANLQLAKLKEANLQGACLGLAKLHGAKLQGVKNLELKQLEKADGDAMTVLPNDPKDKRPSHWS